MMYKPIVLTLAVLALAMLPAGAAVAVEYGDPLVGNVFVTGFDGWTDTHVVITGDAGPPTWGVLLGDDDALCEANNIITGADTSARLNDAISQKLINMNYSTTPSYTLSARVGSWDDDGYGLIFGYVDEANYFQVGARQQNSNTYGFPMGFSVMKFTNGSPSLVQQNAGAYAVLPYLDGGYYDLSVTVDGTTGAYSVTANPGGGAMVEYLTGTDAGLINRGGRYGVHSWAQKEDASAETTAIKPRGTVIKTVTVDDGSDGQEVRIHTFADAVPVAWRPIMMTNAAGAQGANTGGTPYGFNYGNFRQDFRNGTIYDDSNGFTYATATAANVDFIGPAIVVNEEGSADWTDYEMTVRITSGDDEGPGVLVRVADDKTFYRVNFATQAMGTGDTRTPDGLSIQKCVDNGENPPVWTELYRDDQVTPVFQYVDNVPFDLTVRVVGNAITVSLIDDPDGAATPYTWETVYDETNPILSGSVGFTNWGAGDEFNGVYYSAYGGIEGHSLVTAIPEPSMLMLLGLLGICSLAVRRRV